MSLLKGQSHEIFCFIFFINQFILVTLEYPRAVLFIFCIFKELLHF